MADISAALDAPLPESAPAETPLASTRRMRRLPLPVLFAMTIVGAMVLMAVFASLLAPHDPYQQRLGDALLAPRDGAVLGTDELGRDILSRIIYGVRPLLVIASVSVAAAASGGLIVGLVAGLGNRLTSTALMRLADMQLAIPPVIVAVMLAVIFQPGVTTSIFAISVVTWPQYARVVRAETLRVRSSDFVSLARVAGLSRLQIMRRHIVPNVMNSFVVLCTLNLAIAIIFAAALSFLGVGVQAPRPDWGNMLAGGTRYLDSWWIVFMPGAAITLLVLSLNIIGDYVRDRLDPRLSVQ